MCDMGELSSKVRSKISEYLGFDVNVLYNNGDPYIFGGCVRDSIADQEIHDVDILVLPKTFHYLKFFLPSIGYFESKMISKDIMSMYEGIRIINEPISFINNDGKIIQLIRPNFKSINDRASVLEFLSQVDLGCCGVTYVPGEVIETSDSAIIQCRSKKFFVYHSNKMVHRNRIYMRISKLESRGWKEVNKEDKRDLIIDYINEN